MTGCGAVCDRVGGAGWLPSPLTTRVNAYAESLALNHPPGRVLDADAVDAATLQGRDRYVDGARRIDEWRRERRPEVEPGRRVDVTRAATPRAWGRSRRSGCVMSYWTGIVEPVTVAGTMGATTLGVVPSVGPNVSEKRFLTRTFPPADAE